MSDLRLGSPATVAKDSTVDQLLRLEGVRVTYGGLVAVQGVDLSVGSGECVVVLGPNGAGKTSLMGTIAGTVKPAAGDVYFRGRSLRKRRTEQRVAGGITLVPEGRRLFKDLTVVENLTLARAAGRTTDFRARTDQVLETFPVLRARAGHKARLLSGGEQQMLAIARALLTEPELLILDEPSIGLAPKVVHEVYQRLSAVRSQGITLLIVEQNISALDIASEVHVLRNGRVVASGPPEQFRDADVVAEAYLGTD
ncbi:ABC transporter ATP-binding protein [Phytohabitans sp. ZYX-F-186]|uniref:ABC transporter ATP-binding protein n=1 Tax=Phytohabitans maris TaxID=3071409 RepID=A0ABU0ZUU4_9ACTN|nr:ABC transporter ATP-binding protein [Phytohabitans sp. ZYX-F-186]MDQ7910814.1 ABC transporter ATP-binding protein [Phytohabitans sp. ZYX-F-186]